MSPKEIEVGRRRTYRRQPYLLLPLGLMAKLPPYNVAISNVPGIRETMYWNGARMDGSYPLSIVTDGMAMNITLITYDQTCRFWDNCLPKARYLKYNVLLTTWKQALVALGGCSRICCPTRNQDKAFRLQENQKLNEKPLATTVAKIQARRQKPKVESPTQS